MKKRTEFKDGLNRTYTLPHILDIPTLAQYLNLSTVTVIKKCERGEIPAFKIGRLWRFRADRIEQWIEDQEKKGGRKNAAK